MSYSAVQIYDFHIQYIVQELDYSFSNCFSNLSHQISGFFVLQYVTFLTFTASNCGKRWHTYKFGCLQLFERQKKWVAAKDRCAKFNTPGGGNGRLSLILSQDENNRIVKLWLSKGFSEGMVSRNYLRVQ